MGLAPHKNISRSATGYNVCSVSFELIGICKRTSFSVQVTDLYCEVTDNMKECNGVGGDPIEVIEMTIDEVRTYVKQTSVNNTTPDFVLNFQFLQGVDSVVPTPIWVVFLKFLVFFNSLGNTGH